jgi:hypothetical protein
MERTMSGTARRLIRSSILGSMVAALLVALLAAPVLAGTPAGGRVTRGEVTAAFQARTTGGYLNVGRGHLIPAPVRGLQDGRISSFVDGTYCSGGWHYLGVTLLGSGGHTAAAAYLRQTSVSFWIDGAPVPTISTAIKPFVGTGIHGQWGISRGRLLAPGSLSVGTHTLLTRIVTPDFGVENLVVTATVDACG